MLYAVHELSSGWARFPGSRASESPSANTAILFSTWYLKHSPADNCTPGFSEYMAGCVGVNLTNVPDQAGSRIGYWNAALAAFHITNETVNI